MTVKASDADVENAILAYLSGEAAQKVAPRFGICGKRFTSILKDRGLLRTKKQRYAIAGEKNGAIRHATLNLPDSEIVKRYLAGESEKSIAESFGVTRHPITIVLINAGVERRSVAEAMSIRSARKPLRPRSTVWADHIGPHQKSIEEREAAAVNWQERAARGEYARASAGEMHLLKMLQDRGIDVVPQQAIGPYNVDIGAFPVAVEVWGGAFHFSRDHTERFRYLRERGWNVVIVYSDPKRSPISVGAANYVITYTESARSNPAARREYRVIWGDGKVFAAGSLDDENIARIVPRKYFLRSGAGD